MKFKEAFELMKKGFFVKLPSWGGYWCWDNIKETIMMHLKDGVTVMDIRDTLNVEYTLRNMLSDKWIVATEKNTPLLGGVATFGFNEALEYIEKGHNLRRYCWTDKNTYVKLSTVSIYIEAFKEKMNKQTSNYYSDRLDDMTSVIIYGNENLDKNSRIVILTQEDILAKDWCFYNGGK